MNTWEWFKDFYTSPVTWLDLTVYVFLWNVCSAVVVELLKAARARRNA